MITTLRKKFGFLQVVFIPLAFLFACSKADEPISAPLTGAPVITVTTLLSNQGIIWGFDFLPNGNLLFTQKTGTMRLFDTTTQSNTLISGLPANISASGQGGLLDVAISPDYASSKSVYVTYSITGGFLVLARFTLNGNTASNWQVLKTTESASTWNGHFGSRIAFGPDGKLYWSVGEGGGGSLGGASSPHQNGQRLTTMWGKIHRMNLDGTIPTDNPLVPGQTTRTTIFSYGHRNPQGMAFDPKTNQLFVNEHGPSGGCELNRVQAAENFGWPLYSNGINYNGTNISNGHNAAGIVAPLKSWSPAFAPSGLTFINHPAYKDWNGNLLMGSLVRRHLLMIKMTNGIPSSETILLENNGRIRNVKMGPGGKIYVSVEDGGKLIALSAQ
ncbi:PQQ-dependent sugar dehydrogenase [Aquirufa sp.]|jgi:glucose/arabinose dehydrogenase|uniref:PQQ-dependent sugar dehydrogenase n=1 Tax=Aquirufa sp. TaxID=2676249 RepID=UPI0037BE308A